MARHIVLFVLTFLSVSITASLFFVGRAGNLEQEEMGVWIALLDLVLWEGVLFAFLLLSFLGVHEFGHYFAAVRHRIDTSLPYFIPAPLLFIGTFGAVIRIRERIENTRKLFDVGVSGPIAGFVVALFVLMIGFFTLPGPEYLAGVPGHEATMQHIEEHGTFPDEPLEENDMPFVYALGNTLLFQFLASLFDEVPPMWEVYHYPFLFAGWLGLFFTALNLMPVGQLDGGHILYSLLGYRKHRFFARIFFGLMVTVSGAGAMPYLHMILQGYDTDLGLLSWMIWGTVAFLMLRKGFNQDPNWYFPGFLFSLAGSMTLAFLFTGLEGPNGFTPWVIWCFFILFLAGIEHPPVMKEEPLTPGRKILGWTSIVIFFLCMTPTPITIL